MIARITLLLDDGSRPTAEESWLVPEDQELDGPRIAVEELIERIEDREDPWKTFGDSDELTVNFRHIKGFEFVDITNEAIESLKEAA